MATVIYNALLTIMNANAHFIVNESKLKYFYRIGTFSSERVHLLFKLSCKNITLNLPYVHQKFVARCRTSKICGTVQNI